MYRTAGEVAAACARRLDEADDAAPVQWVAAHFPALLAGELQAAAPADPALLPEAQGCAVERLQRRWQDAVQEAMLPPAGKTSAVSKLFRKGLPVPSSLRYIGQQMQRACATQRPAGTAEALRDVCVAGACDVWGNDAAMPWRERYRRWKLPPLQLYNEFMRPLRPVQVQKHIADFVKGVVRGCPLLLFMSTRNTPSYFHCAAMQSVLQKIGRRAAKRTRERPHRGFGLVVPERLSAPLRAAVAYRNGTPPSAKRIRSSVSVTPELRAAIDRQSTPAHASAALAYRQDALPDAWAGKCTQGCGWLRRPVGGAGGGDVVVDMAADAPVCGACGAPAVIVRVNGAQLQYAAGWARLCDECSVFTVNWRLVGAGAVCRSCYSARKPHTRPAAAAAKPR